MTKPDTPAKKYDTEEATPVAAYVVLVVLVVALVAVIFLNTGSKDTQAASASFSSTQTMERMGGSAVGSSAEGGAGQAAQPTYVPPVEPLVKEKMHALETSEPSLEGNKQCFWLEKNSGNKRWVPVTAIYGTALSKYSCYELDSCDGGLAKSRGDCYKWAPSATSQRDPW